MCVYVCLSTSRNYFFFEIMFCFFCFSAVDWARFVPFVCPLWAAEAISPPVASLFCILCWRLFICNSCCSFSGPHNTVESLYFLLLFSLCMSQIKFIDPYCRTCVCAHVRSLVWAPHNNSKHFSILFPFDMINRNGCDEKFNARMFQSELRSSMGNFEYIILVSGTKWCIYMRRWRWRVYGWILFSQQNNYCCAIRSVCVC